MKRKQTVFILILTLIFQACNAQMDIDQSSVLNGRWLVELESNDIGAIKTIFNFESTDSTFIAYTREGADKAILGFWKSTMARIFTKDFENGSLIRITDGIIQNRNDTTFLAAIFQTAQTDTATKLNETKKYILKKQTENSDFNYSKLMPIFEPVSGQYNYYQFISTYVGQAYNSDGPPLFEDFHDILIIKTDNKNKMIDAYQYTLEWSEPPLQYDVFKSSAKNITLTNNIKIAELKFKRTYSWSEDNKEMNESGIIKLQ